MADEKPDKPRATRTYKVLRPILPTAAEYEAHMGETSLRYEGLGEYVAESPEAAVEKAADEFAAPPTGPAVAGRFIAIAVSGWQERDAVAEATLVWKITRPGTVEEVSPEDAAAVGEGEPTVEIEEPTQEMPTEESPTVEDAVVDEDTLADEQAAAEALEAEAEREAASENA